MRIPVLSDIHANLQALDAVLADASTAGADHPAWVLGDIVGYGPDPDGVVARLRVAGAHVIAGNHDLAAIGRLSVADFNPLAAAAAEWTARQINEETRKFLASLPKRTEARAFTLVHGSPRDPIWEYLHSAEAFVDNLQHFETAGCLFGHTHLPMLVVFPEGEPALAPNAGGPIPIGEGRFYINPGSVGQPRDGDNRASYALLDPESGTVEFRRVAYPIAETQERMRRAGLPEPLVTRLSVGR